MYGIRPPPLRVVLSRFGYMATSSEPTRGGGDLDPAQAKAVPELGDLGDTQEDVRVAISRRFLRRRPDLAPGRAGLLVHAGPHTGTAYEFDADAVIGRHPTCDILLSDITVSRRHAELRRLGDLYEIVDLGSLNGTYVNGDRVEDAVLAMGDEVQIGKFRFVFLTGA